jgi:hypothetical protein
MASTTRLGSCLLLAVLVTLCQGAFADDSHADARPGWLQIAKVDATKGADDMPPAPPLDPSEVKPGNREGISPADAKGNRWFGKVGYSYIFDYWFDDPGLSGKNYKVSGSMYSMAVGSYGKGGWGWMVNYGYAPNIEFNATQKSSGATVDVKMERHDMEFTAYLPLTKTGDWGRAGLTAGWKLAYIEKEVEWNNISWYEEQTLWTGPMLGGYFNIPLCKDQSVSWFGSLNGMVLYTKQDNENPFRATTSQCWSTIGYGANGTTGIRWNFIETKKVSGGIEGGYRGQILTTMDDFAQRDMYQAVFGTFSLRF